MRVRVYINKVYMYLYIPNGVGKLVANLFTSVYQSLNDGISRSKRQPTSFSYPQ